MLLNHCIPGCTQAAAVAHSPHRKYITKGTDMNKTHPLLSSGPRIALVASRGPLLAMSLLAAAALAGCNREEAPVTAPPAPASSTPAPASAAPAAPAAGTSAPSTAQPTAAPASAAPASAATSSAAPAASSSTNAPGTPQGAANTLPSQNETAVEKSAASSETASDSKETKPLSELTKEEETKGMPEALQAGNNHSSTALDKEAK